MNVLLVSHQGVASGMKEAVHMITGEQKNLHTIELTETGVGEFSTALTSYLEERKHTDQALLVLADLKGGTPYNQAVALVHKLDLEQFVHVVSGVNLPLILETLFMDDSSFTISDLERVITSSKEAIFKAGPLEQNNNDLDE
ncbi:MULTISPECIES: PTS sugar transporter subunit IIA [Gracilibacillus]|uniref:PTS sugar transporter subunit IIA n=1 Tax=Gracilibacillus TaxID=74385 RepID=UPI0008264EA2|nr:MULTISPECIES: PTS sugar transporter subunit IIA [Gracilibacillus]